MISEINEMASDSSRTRTDQFYVEGDNFRLIAEYQWDKVDQKWYLNTRDYYYYSGSVRTRELSIADLKISPNPVAASMPLRVNVPVEVPVTVQDMFGRTVQYVPKGHNGTLQLGTLAPGTYTISAVYDGKNHYAKVVVVQGE
jgi:hypothetical protein